MIFAFAMISTSWRNKQTWDCLLKRCEFWLILHCYWAVWARFKWLWNVLFWHEFLGWRSAVGAAAQTKERRSLLMCIGCMQHLACSTFCPAPWKPPIPELCVITCRVRSLHKCQRQRCGWWTGGTARGRICFGLGTFPALFFVFVLVFFISFCTYGRLF